METRSGAVNRTLHQLTQEAKAGFEEGVGLIFSQWTALVLAVENQWGGSNSEQKADYFIEDILEWFYRKRGQSHQTVNLAAAVGTSPSCSNVPSSRHLHARKRFDAAV